MNGWGQGGGRQEEKGREQGGEEDGQRKRGKRRGGKGWKRGCGREKRGNIKMFDEIKERMDGWMSDIRKRRDGGENYEDGCWRDGGMEERRTKKK